MLGGDVYSSIMKTSVRLPTSTRCGRCARRWGVVHLVGSTPSGRCSASAGPGWVRRRIRDTRDSDRRARRRAVPDLHTRHRYPSSTISVVATMSALTIADDFNRANGSLRIELGGLRHWHTDHLHEPGAGRHHRRQQPTLIYAARHVATSHRQHRCRSRRSLRPAPTTAPEAPPRSSGHPLAPSWPRGTGWSWA